jgi:DNA polymerase-3 subunit delta'
MEMPWLNQFTASWRASVRHGRAPHALMLLGAAGTGKRCLAAWLASCRLGMSTADSEPQYPLSIPEHADLHWLSPPEDKHTVGIEQIRELVASLSLTSYTGSGKVAVIDPANAMTASATNSLLKTLEEPPGDALLILVADRVGRLPATIFSRCQRVSIAIPAESVSLQWLDRLHLSNAGSSGWPTALAAAGNAPLMAVRSLEQMEDTDGMARDFAALPEQSASPLDVAARWAKHEPEFVLNWLGRQVQLCILRVFGGLAAMPGGGVSDSVLQRIDRRNLFCYLDVINKLRGQPAGSFNVQLNLESLLIDWASGLPDRDM